MPLKVHFLNVGMGDCTIIEFPSGRVGIVDIFNLKVLDRDTKAELLEEYQQSAEFLMRRAYGAAVGQLEQEFIQRKELELTDPLAYYNLHIGEYRDIFRFLVSHPDMDHITGLYRLHKQDRSKSILNFWHTGFHDFNLADIDDSSWQASPYDKRDWLTYRELRASTGNAPTSLQKYQGATGDFWTEDGLELWAPTPELERIAVENEQPNIISMVLKLTYCGRSIVLGGDATAEETWSAIYPHLNMHGINVLKASHHGRKSGYSSPAVKEMSPWLTITSVGEKAKEYDATESYRRYSEYTVSLRKAGDICITIMDDGTLFYPRHIEEHWKPRL